jgi:hypothetical protein
VANFVLSESLESIFALGPTAQENNELVEDLLRDHILIAADIVAAARAGDSDKLNASKTKWTANADDIAAFLSAANPKNWPAADMKAMMRDHLAATTAELEARLNKDWAGDVKAYDRVHDQIVTMSDALSDGIIKQFPAKF